MAYNVRVGEPFSIKPRAESGTERLMTSLIAIQKDKEDRARQAELDRIAVEEQQRRAAMEDEQRQMRLIEFQQKMAAMAPAKKETVQVTEPPPSKEVWEAEPTAAESAAYLQGLPAPTPVEIAKPSESLQTTLGGQAVEAPMLNYDELQARADDQFMQRLEQERQLTEARQRGYTLPQDDRLGALSGVEVPESAVGQIFTQALRPGKAIERTVDLGDKVEYIYTDGQTEIKPKGRLSTGDDDPTGMTTRQNINLNQITTKFQADAIMRQAEQGANISGIADQVITAPDKAVNQLKALYILVKNLDPTSAVREGELGLAMRTQSYIDQWLTQLKRVSDGAVISPDAARQLAMATKEISDLWNNAARRRDAQYRSQANVMGVGKQFEQYLGGFANVYSEPAAPADNVPTLPTGLSPNVEERLRKRLGENY